VEHLTSIGSDSSVELGLLMRHANLCWQGYLLVGLLAGLLYSA